MSRKVDFGNNCDITFGSISYYFFRLFLGIEATVRFAVVFTGVTSDDCFCSLGTDFCQLRIFLDFQTPALVFGNMPVKTVHIVQSHHIDISFHFIYCKEMTAGIEVCTTIAKAGSVIDFYSGHGNVCADSHRQ